MKSFMLCASALALSAGGVTAGGLDRSFQNSSAIFSPEGTVTTSIGIVNPSVTGTDALGNSYDVGENYTNLGLSYTNKVGEAFSYALIMDQPYGADVSYGNDPTTSTLGGTGADLNSTAVTFIGRYNINARLSFFGGLSIERVDAAVDLNGLAYANAISARGVAGQFNASLPSGATQLDASVLAAAAYLNNTGAQALLDATYGVATSSAVVGQAQATRAGFQATDGYSFEMEQSTKVGYLVGAAYEIPDIALRVAATYRFETEHSADTTENLLGTVVNGDIDYVTPQSLNLDFQTGIAPGTLLTASYRWTEFSAVDVIPDRLGSDLVNLDDIRRFTVGVARRFNDNFAGSVTLIYEPEGDRSIVSPLSPTDGSRGISVGGRYTNGNMSISGGLNYTVLGDANAGVGTQSVASFKDNSATAFGLRVEFTF